MMTEDMLEQEALGWLAEVGYTHAPGSALAPGSSGEGGRESWSQVVLTERLKSAIARLNPHLPASAREDALAQVLNLDVPSMLGANRHFHKLLTYGVPVTYREEGQVDGQERGDFVRLLDFETPANNDWLAVNQFTIAGPRHTRRPDIVLFVNGLPLVVVELKNPADPEADIWKAFDQLETYKEHIPDLFSYNEVLIISDGTEARMGSLSAKEERFMSWRTIDGTSVDPLGQCRELETLVRGLLAPEYFLDYLRFFIVFEDDLGIVKKIAGYHQFHAVRAAVEQAVLASGAGGDKRGGVVWHTQGSGKSMTMTCFSACIMRHTAMHNPTIVVVTDRNDLDGQLFGTFSLAQDLLRERPVQATSRNDMREKLNNRPSGGIVFTTIQKFMLDDEETEHPLLSDRANIVVIADEAHRSQYGFAAKLATGSKAGTYTIGHAHYLRKALPNATFVAFTGTPVSLQDRDTRSVFGDYIHIYDMQQAKEDGATVPIYYESRLAKLGLNAVNLAELDEDVDELLEDEEEALREKHKSAWAAMEKIVGADPRLEAVARDMVEHFDEREKTLSGKAMIVAMNREICARLYEVIVALRPDWHSDAVEEGAIKVIMTGSASDKPLLRKHLYSPTEKKRLERRFKDPADPLRVVIVRDMWLTGFDAPCLGTMYLDKPMKGHNLMQAIARVNRVFRDKEGGLIVDYIGIGTELENALREYTGSKGRGKPTYDIQEAFAVFLAELEKTRHFLHGFDYSAFLTSGHRLLAGAANHILGLEDGKKRYCDTVLAMTKAYTLCYTLQEAHALREEVAFLQAVRVLLTKRDASGKKKTHEAREQVIRQIIAQTVVSEDVVDIFNAVGLDKPNIGLLDEAFLNKVRALPERNLAAELLERLLEGEIKSRLKTNIVQGKKFSDLLRNVISRYHNRSIDTAKVIEELAAMAQKFQEAMGRGKKLGLNNDELAFYDALSTNDAAVTVLGDQTLALIAQDVARKLRENLSVDWQNRESVQAKLRIAVRNTLRKYKYPPDGQEEAIALVLEQAKELGQAWAQEQ